MFGPSLENVNTEIERRVDDWLMVHYSESITFLPKAVFRRAFIECATRLFSTTTPTCRLAAIDQLLDNQLCETNLLEPVMRTAHVVTRHANDQLQQILKSRNDAFVCIYAWCMEALNAKNVLISPEEVEYITAELIYRYTHVNVDRAVQLINDRYITAKNIQLINSAMKRIESKPVEHMMMARKLINYFAVFASDWERKGNIFPVIDIINKNQFIPPYIGRLICYAEKHGGDLPGLLELAQVVAYLIPTQAVIDPNYANDGHAVWQSYTMYRSQFKVSDQAAPIMATVEQTDKSAEIIRVLELEENIYRSIRRDDEIVITREYGIHPESKEPMYGMWVMRNVRTGEFIDADRYSNDLKERHNIEVL